MIFISLLILPFAYAETWEDMYDAERMWDGQKTITNQEFEQVMDALEEKKEKKEKKIWKKKLKRIGGGGTSLHPELNPDKDISEIPDMAANKDGILINVPVDLHIDGNLLERGYYKVIGTREDGKILIDFYQSQYYKGTVEAIETQDDYGEAELDFAKILSYNEGFVKMIFGSIDFNAYAYIPFSE